MITLRMFEESDYPMVSEWWVAHAWPAVPYKFLSRFGLIALDENDTPLCAGWLYLTSSGFAWMEYLVSNPGAPLKVKARGIECLTSRLISEAKNFGAHALFTSVKHRSLIRLYQRLGFAVGDTGMTNMVCSL